MGKNRTTTNAMAMLAVMLGILGCGSEQTSRTMSEAAGAKKDSGPTAKPDADAATKAKPLVVLDYEGIQKLIASHKGKVVVVDAWATYCPPCMRDFHHLVDLHKQYGADKVACVSLSFDFGDDAKLEELKPRIQAFLDRQGATFDNIVSSEPWDDLYKKFDFAAVPAVFVYGTDGKLIARIDHSGDDETPIYERVKALVKKQVEG